MIEYSLYTSFSLVYVVLGIAVGTIIFSFIRKYGREKESQSSGNVSK